MVVFLFLVQVGRKGSEVIGSFFLLSGFLVIRIFQKWKTERIAVFDLFGGVAKAVFAQLVDLLVKVVNDGGRRGSEQLAGVGGVDLQCLDHAELE